MKKWIAAVAALALIGVGWQQLKALTTVGPKPEPGIGRELNLPTVASVLPAPAGPADERVSAISEVPQTTPIERVEPVPVDAGWWLVGQVTGVPEGESALTKLSIEGSGNGLRQAMNAATEPDGSIRVDLSQIFRSDAMLPDQLRLLTTHPGRDPAEQVWSVQRTERQAGFIPGKLAVFEVDQHLEEPFGVLRGEVELPTGYLFDDISLLLVAAGEVPPNPCQAIAEQDCDASGRFSLNYPEPGAFHVVAWHKDKRLRPAWLPVDAIAGASELQLRLDEGAVYEGQMTLAGQRPEFELEFELSNSTIDHGACPEGGDLRWHAGAYHYATRNDRTFNRGAFRITGLAAGQYTMSLSGLTLAEQRVGLVHEGVFDARPKAHFPNPSAALELDFQISLFECFAHGRSVPGVKLFLADDQGRMRTQMDETGKLALAHSRSGFEGSIEFKKAGYTSTLLQIHADRQLLARERIELQSEGAARATLDLRLIGDPTRNLERFHVALLQAGEEASDFELDPWQRTQWKRTEGAVRIEGIRPGGYRLTVAAADPSSRETAYPDTACTILSVVREVTFEAGEARALTVELIEGGRAWLQAVYPDGNDGGQTGGISYQVLDHLGSYVPTHWVSKSGKGTHTIIHGMISQATDCFLEPPLPAGNYTLEIWGKARATSRLSYPFRIVAGENTTLTVSDPR